MRFLVLGAGKMGYAVAYDLIRSPNVDKVFVADIDEARLQEVTDKLSDEKVVPCKADVTKFEQVTELMSGCNVVIGCVTYHHNYDLAKASLEAGVSFCDLGGNEQIVRKELLLDEFAKERGVAIVPACGLAPGLVSILTAAATEGMEEIYEIRIRVGGLPLEPKPPLDYSLVFSVEGLINEYVEPASVIVDGKRLRVPSLTQVEEIEFPEPFGMLEAFVTSGGLSTLTKSFEGRVQHLDYKTIRYPGHCEKVRTMALLGLMESEPVTVDSSSIAPRKLLARLLEDKLPKNDPDVVLLRITVTGVRDQEPLQIVWEGIDCADEATGLTAMMRMTAFPASIIAQMIARNDITEKGVLLQEKHIPVRLFLAEMGSRGTRLAMSEREPVA